MAQTVIKKMGTAKPQTFNFPNAEEGTSDSSSVGPYWVYAALVVVSALALMWWRNHAQQGPVLTLTPDITNNASGIQNLANSLLAIEGMINLPANPQGGVSTPTTTVG